MQSVEKKKRKIIDFIDYRRAFRNLIISVCINFKEYLSYFIVIVMVKSYLAEFFKYSVGIFDVYLTT